MNFDQKILALKTRIEQAQNILISTHRNPDGDAMGSSLAWYQMLKKKGKGVRIVLPDDYPAFYSWVPFADDCIVYEADSKGVKQAIQASDLIFSLDYNAFHRTADGLAQLLEKSKAFKVLVDHHRQPDEFDLMFSDIGASSTSEMIYQIIEGLAWEKEVDLPIAECIYTGIVTDTGSFRFSSTSAYTMQVAAKLMEKGLDSGRVQSLIYDNNSESRLRLMGYALSEKMEVHEKERYAFISLTSAELEEFNYQKGDTEGLVNYPLSVQSVNISVLIKERNTQHRMSFRSKGNINVNDLARKYFNGGGHQNAAGGVSELSMEETISKLKKVVTEFSTVDS